MSVHYVIIPIIIISLAIIFSGLINITYGQVNETSQSYTYENTSEGIRFQYPSYWGNVTLAGGCFFKPCIVPVGPTDLKTPAFDFVIFKFFDKSSGLKPSCGCDTLTEFLRWSYEINQEVFNGFRFISDNQTTVGNKYPAWQYEFTGSIRESPDQRSPKLLIATKSDDSFYAIGFNPYTDQYRVQKLPEFRKLIDSIEFLPVERALSRTPSFLNTNPTVESTPNTTLDNDPNGLQILSHNSFRDSMGYLHVVGEIKNNYPATATFVRILGTFYNINNQVVGTQFTYANPSDIGSREKAPFELLLTSASVPISQINHYNLRATYQ
jgi:hypothetical protein